MSPSSLPIVRLLGVEFHAVTERECVQHVATELGAGRGGWIITPNLDHTRRLVADADLRALYSGADLSVADGLPIVWASRLQGTPLPERVAGSDLIWSLSGALAEDARGAFFLGGDPGTAERAAEALCARYPGLVVAGTSCPEVGFERDPARMDALRAELSAAAPDLVFVALGSPKQERLIETLRAEHPATWWIGIGISFSFVAGDVARAPRWIQRLGLEWVHRLIQEPRRLARRYLIEGLPFAFRLFAGALRARFSGGASGR